MFIREFIDGQTVDQALLVSGKELRRKRDGGEYLKLELSDRSGRLAAMIWEPTESLAEITEVGNVVFVSGQYNVHPRWGAQLMVRDLRSAISEEYSLVDLLDGPTQPVAEMAAELNDLIASVANPHLKTLLLQVLGEDTPTGEAFREAPAAKRNHQAYRHGLLEHCLSVAQAVAAVAGIFPGIDRDIAVTGALLHDIGKLQAYTRDPQSIDFTNLGRLQGEIPLGYYLIRREIEQLDDFPNREAEAILHIILSHHGMLEFGSPVVPCTREATLVHMMDNLGGRLGTFDRLEQSLADGEQWSQFDRALSGSAFFG